MPFQKGYKKERTKYKSAKEAELAKRAQIDAW